MRNKTPLVLMEQLVMVLVFALAAALCLQAFVLADNRSRQAEIQDQALLEAHNAVETLKSCAGDYETAAQLCRGTWDGTVLRVFYDEAWQSTVEETPAYTLTATPVDSAYTLLGRAEIAVADEDGVTLCAFPAAWQEVDDHG